MRNVGTQRSSTRIFGSLALATLLIHVNIMSQAPPNPPNPLNSTPSTTPIFTQQQLLSKMGSNPSTTVATVNSLPFPVNKNYPSFYVIPLNKRALVMDQKSCGACVAFSTSAAISTMLNRRSDLMKAAFPVRNMILSNDNLFAPDPMSLFRNANRACEKDQWNSGWYVDEAARFVRNRPTPMAFAGTVLSDVTVNAGSSGTIDDKSVLPPGVTKIDAMRSFIANQGALVADFTVFLSLNYYKSGIYNHQTFLNNASAAAQPLMAVSKGGHAVLVIGYFAGGKLRAGDLAAALYGGSSAGLFSNVEVDAPPFWIVQNSWGGGWGMNGLFFVEVGQPDLGLEDSMTYLMNPILKRKGVVISP